MIHFTDKPLTFLRHTPFHFKVMPPSNHLLPISPPATNTARQTRGLDSLPATNTAKLEVF